MAETTAVNSQITDTVATGGAAMPIGRFVWHDLITPDVQKAQRYYADLLGWSYKGFSMGEGTYDMIHAGGTEWGGFMPVGSVPGLETQWLSYVTVPDVDAATAAAERLGGRVLVPGTDIPTVGRYAIIASPSGAVVCPFAPIPPESPRAEPKPAPGTFVWHELLAADPKADGRFFCEILGWRIEEVPMGEMGTYSLLKRLDSGTDAGGMMAKPQGEGGPSAWLPYVQVESADRTAARTTELGGKVCVPPTDIPGVGRFTVTSDPDGAMIGFHQPQS